EFEVIERRFTTIEEMERWKHRVETLSMATFTKESNHGSRQYFWCSRGNKKRTKEKSQLNRVSKRTQSHCSAFINVWMVAGGISVRACLDHVNHDCDPTMIPLNPTQRKDLDHILTQGFKVTATREKLREYGEQHPFYWISSERAVKKMMRRRMEKKRKMEEEDEKKRGEEEYFDVPMMDDIYEEDFPTQSHYVDDEEVKRREREKEEEERRRNLKLKYRALCLEAINKVSAGVNQCMREDEDERRLKEIYEGIMKAIEGMEGRSEENGRKRLERREQKIEGETRGDIKRRKNPLE
ncbi:hypothetical protein PMAYCL1PPCAC_24448, partial [Pristionchus mayeri]